MLIWTRSLLHGHWFVAVVITALTLVVTFPIIAYVFRTDVFWLPSGDSRDIYISLWDTWYGNLVVQGQADRYFTDLIFYPEGVSLASHPLFSPQIILVNLLNGVLPLSNAFILSYLVLIWFTSVAAYVYLLYLFNDKWLALFGAVVFGFSSHVLSHFNHPHFMFLSTLPSCLYFFHRGVAEQRWTFAIVAGLLAGFTTEINLYLYVCILLVLSLWIPAFAVKRWRDLTYWRFVIILILTICGASVWRLYPLHENSQTLVEILARNNAERTHDLISYFFSYHNQFTAPLFSALVKPPERSILSTAAYMGILPLALLCFGLICRRTRNQMLPWTIPLASFFVLSLGSTLIVYGTTFQDFPLPKRILSQLLPAVFSTFYEPDHFIMGMILPLAILATYGLSCAAKENCSGEATIVCVRAHCSRRPRVSRPG